MATYRGQHRSQRNVTKRRRNPTVSIPPSFEAGIFDEPNLTFGGHHQHIDPKTGLALYGPYSVGRDDQMPLRSITVAVVGTPDLVFRMNNWLRGCQGIITNDGSEPFWRPAFPGINQNSCFQCDLVFGETWQEMIDPATLDNALRIPKYWEQLQEIVRLYTSAVEQVTQREPKPTVIACIIPEEIDACLDALAAGMPKEAHPAHDRADYSGGESGKRIKDETTSSDDYATGCSPFNIRRALKAAFMRFEIPTQLVRGSTIGQPAIGVKRQRQDDATQAWNLVTALYYKAGSHPWRLANVQAGTCYVGISFYREKFGDKPGMRTSLAQIFTHTGDGLILRGKSFPWDRSQGPSPHLPESFAEELLTDAIGLYTRHARGVSPTRLVLHKSSRFDGTEQRGFQNAVGNSIPRCDFVAMEKRGIQLFRRGYHAPLRGTWVRLADGDFLLYTRGYIPFFRIYPGMRVPQPLEIVELLGNSPADSVLSEILALTKMNWNSADFSCEEPITLAFSRKVGEVLALIPRAAPMKEEYRYYM